MTEIRGYRITIHNSVTTPIMFAGIPRRLAILGGTLFFALVVGLHLFFFIPIGLFLYIGAVWCYKRDPHFLSVVQRYLKRRGRFYNV